MKLPITEPFDWTLLLTWLGARAIPGVESVGDGSYTRGHVRVACADGALQVSGAAAGERAAVEARVGRLFDLDARPAAIAAVLGRDRMLAPLLRKRPGIRVPGAWDPFELAVRAIVGQQVSVAGARTVLGRIAEQHAITAEALSAVDVGGMPRSRAATIRGVAEAVMSGALRLERGATLEETVGRLTAIRGIGPWTAHYVAMRLGEPDAFPAGDLVLRRHAGELSERELLEKAERWRPFRAYAAMLLWTR